MKKYLIVAACNMALLAIVGCNNMQPAGQETGIVSFHNLDKHVELRDADIVGEVKLIHPERSIVLGHVDKLLTHDTLLYVLDRQQMTVEVMTHTGRHVARIDRIGHGNGEYIDLTDIFIDSKGATLNLVSRNDRKLLVFDIAGHKLQSVKPLPKMFAAMRKTSTGYLGYMANYSEDKDHPYNFWTLDNELNLQDSYSKINPILESRYNADISALSQYGDRYDGICQMDRHIYSLDSGSHFFQPWVLDFGSLNLPEQSQADLNDEQKQFINQNRYISHVLRFQETEQYIMVFVLYQGQRNILVYDKSSKKTSRVLLSSTTATFYPLSFGNVVGADEHHIYATIDADDVRRICTGKTEYVDFESQYPKQVKALRQAVHYPFDNENSFIAVYQILHKEVEKRD